MYFCTLWLCNGYGSMLKWVRHTSDTNQNSDITFSFAIRNKQPSFNNLSFYSGTKIKYNLQSYFNFLQVKYHVHFFLTIQRHSNCFKDNSDLYSFYLSSLEVDLNYMFALQELYIKAADPFSSRQTIRVSTMSRQVSLHQKYIIDISLQGVFYNRINTGNYENNSSSFTITY